MKKTNITLRTLTKKEIAILDGLIKDFHNIGAKTKAIQHCIKSYPRIAVLEKKIELLQDENEFLQSEIKHISNAIATVFNFTKDK